MKKIMKLGIVLLFTSNILFAQSKYFTRSGSLTFFSKTPVENIEAKNNQASSIFDTESGEIALSAQMKGFEFEKALMQEHFNENYVESHKYPKATFKGKIKDFSFQSISETLVEVEVVGILNIHGVDKEVTAIGTIAKQAEKFRAQSTFFVSAADFDIKIPAAVIKNIADQIEVTVDLQLEPYVQ